MGGGEGGVRRGEGVPISCHPRPRVLGTTATATAREGKASATAGLPARHKFGEDSRSVTVANHQNGTISNLV